MRFVYFFLFALFTVQPLSAQQSFGSVMKELQGEWWGQRKKVIVEVKGNDFIIKENTSQDNYVKTAQMKPGLVIAQLTGMEADPDNATSKRVQQYLPEGKCWTTNGEQWLLATCGRPLFSKSSTQGWKLHIAGLTLWRKADLEKAGFLPHRR